MSVLLTLFMWLLLGSASALLAHRSGRNPILWFVIGMFLGVFALLLFLFLPSKNKVVPLRVVVKIPPPADTFRSKMWFCIDVAHQQRGPLSFPQIEALWHEKKLLLDTFVWSDGMAEWKRLSEVDGFLLALEKLPG